jgi:hypothetical protein
MTKKKSAAAPPSAASVANASSPPSPKNGSSNGKTSSKTTAVDDGRHDHDAVSVSKLLNLQSLFGDKSSYQQVAKEFHLYHKNTANVAMHLLTTVLGVWGTVQLVLLYFGDNSGGVSLDTAANHLVGPLLVASYAAFVAMTAPAKIGILHGALLVVMPHPATVLKVVEAIVESSALSSTHLLSLLHGVTEMQLCLAAIVLGYGLQDLAHYVCAEPTYLGSYITTQPYLLVMHTVWLLPLVLEACILRSWFLPQLLVPRRRLFALNTVASQPAVDELRAWIAANVPETAETTHVWPHRNDGTTKHVTALEQDASILAGFRTIFPAAEYDIVPVRDMNEIYVTAVGSKSEINSDAVFYTPHVDGPYWWLPGASLYRVLVATTENRLVRTRFNLQHPSSDCVVDLYGVLGFDYNRELHWIDHVPHATNQERRSLIKLHFCVYPKGWTKYGALAAHWNSAYNTWARNNFLRTLRPSGLYENGLAWWIWLTTWVNATLEEAVGWTNLVYVAAAFGVSLILNQPWIFVILTSFRHYAMYIATFAFRENVAHGVLMRDAKLYKTLSMLHLTRLLLPVVELPKDVPMLALASCGFALTLLATYRLGMVRTYFGTELGLVPPKFITDFPYGTIPHPMIVGQIFGMSVLLASLHPRLTPAVIAVLAAHIGSYTGHMVQEILTSAY